MSTMALGVTDHGIGLLIMASTAVLLAGCGSSTPAGGATTAANASTAGALRYASCMRSHGVTNFPDPNATGGFTINSAVNTSSPGFTTAAATCAHVFPGGGGPVHVPATVQARLLANARCMRAHGVPNFPDPVFGAGGTPTKIAGRGQLNIDAPAFQRAARICKQQVLRPAGNTPGSGSAAGDG